MHTKTFPLHGYERFFAMDRNSGARLAHILTVRGDTPALLEHLPLAVMSTFNLHPKMRAVLLPGISPQKVMICPPLLDASELEAVYAVRDYARSKRRSSNTEDEHAEIGHSCGSHSSDSVDWMAFVESECEKTIDREKDFPYSFCVLTDSDTPQLARIVLFSDNYMSDSVSGILVLETVLKQLMEAAKSNGSAPHKPHSLPLHGSLYESMHYVNPWLGVLNEVVSKFVLQPLANFESSGFTPVLPVQRETQQDYNGTPPVPRNPSFALFSTGSPENMRRALERCQEHGVSLQGALVVATALAIGMIKYNGCLTACESDLRFKMEVDADMRSQTSHEGAVGLYSARGSLVFTSSQGVAARSTSFWALARTADHEWQCVLEGHEMKLQSLFVNETLNAEHGPSSLHAANSIVCDTALTCTDPTAWTIQELAVDAAGASVSVDSLHVYKSLPSLAAAASLFVTATSGFNYSLMHKLEPLAAKEFFHWFVQCVEHMGEVTPTEPLAQVASRLKELEALGEMVQLDDTEE